MTYDSAESAKRDSGPNRVRMGLLPARYSFVLNPYVRKRFTKCPKCEAPTRARKLALVIHVNHSDGPRLVLLNKSCRLCLVCETLVVDQAELEQLVTAGVGAAHEYVVLGTIDRRTWRRGSVGEAQFAEIREHMADFKKYLKVEVTRAHRERSDGLANRALHRTPPASFGRRSRRG